MNKLLKQFSKQIFLILILIMIVIVLNNIFVKSSFKGNYDSLNIGIKEGAERREIESFLKKSFKEDFDYKKKLEVETIGSFGTEFRIKSSELFEEEKDYIKSKLEEKYEEVNVTAITTELQTNYKIGILIYLIYFVVIVILSFLSFYMLSLIPIVEEKNINNFKGSLNAPFYFLSFFQILCIRPYNGFY